MRRTPWFLLLILSGCVYEGRAYYTEEVASARYPVTADDLRALSKAGVGDDVIVARLETEGVPARPTAEEVARLKQEGVSDRVMQAWVSAKVTPKTERRVVYRSPYYSGVGYPYYYPYYPYYGGWWGWGYPYWGFSYSYYRHCH